MSAFCSAHMCNQLLVSRMAGVQFPALPMSVVLLAAANGARFVAPDFLPLEVFALAAFLMWAAYVVETLSRFARCLGINILTIPY